MADLREESSVKLSGLAPLTADVTPEAMLSALHASASLGAARFSAGLAECTPLWHHPCFVDLMAETDPPPAPSEPSSAKGRAGLAVGGALLFVADALESIRPALDEETRRAAALAVAALRGGAQLSALVPVGLGPPSSKRGVAELHSALEAVVGKLRAVPVGGVAVLPAGWSAASCATLLLALRRVGEERWAIAVCSASAGLAYHPHFRQPLQVDDEVDPVLVLPDLYRGIAYSLPSADEGARLFYEVLLPFFAQQPLPAALMAHPPPAAFRRLPSRNGDPTRACAAVECMNALLLLGGAAEAEVKGVELLVCWQLVRSCVVQLGALAKLPQARRRRPSSPRLCSRHCGRVALQGSIGAGEAACLRASCRTLARKAAAQALLRSEADANWPQHGRRLADAAATVQECGRLAELLWARHAGFALNQARGDGTQSVGGGDCRGATSFPLFGRLLRDPPSVEHLAGEAPPAPTLRPVALTSVPDSVATVHEVVSALTSALHECTLLSNQEALVKNSACLRVALLQHLFISVIPLPLPLTHPQRASCCFWATEPMLHESQTQILRLLALLAQHHAAASLCLKLTRELDAARIVATACMAAIADAVLRKATEDTTSVLSDHYAGRTDGPVHPFGIDHDPFAIESETLKFTEPQLIVARGMCLDYFASLRQQVRDDHRLFTWGKPSEFGAGELRLVAQVCAHLGFPSDKPAAYLAGTNLDLIELFPELANFRDLLFLFKLFMCPALAMLPERRRWRPSDARLSWRLTKEEKVEVRAFGDQPLKAGIEQGSRMSTRWMPFFLGNKQQGPRTPLSRASPSELLGSKKLFTVEEDFLDLSTKELLDMQRDDGDDPTAKPPLASHDAELLLSYLTVPYLRIPLLLHFFADQQRMNALGSKRMQEVLESALFEPGAWQATEDRAVPAEVPVRSAEHRAQLLSTPLGLLMNELRLAPELVLEPLERLLAMALDMDTGAVGGASARIIFFVVRLAVRVESYVCFIQQHDDFWGAAPRAAAAEAEEAAEAAEAAGGGEAGGGEAGGEGADESRRRADSPEGARSDGEGAAPPQLIARRNSTPALATHLAHGGKEPGEHRTLRFSISDDADPPRRALPRPACPPPPPPPASSP
ncbi:hypothetical protein AB1Y20_018426 [Prymnesium parvum]|uniref:ubiquitinyl hydrolase 1 n=1 Tax=Prymnesium parvum TaxID=97485 RepID=A0AB34JNN6_PRYPA